jgi:hypothetical protein
MTSSKKVAVLLGIIIVFAVFSKGAKIKPLVE